MHDAVRRMCGRMAVRGPDALGYWSDGSISLGHRRLSVIDLDARANQPMHSDDGRYVIVYNGEIYNFRELRHELEQFGDQFRTQSDTEVLIKLFAREGPGMFTRLRGMFALAIWDRLAREVLLARDPYGIKPLYIGDGHHYWLFASQVKALLASDLVSDEADIHGQVGFWLLGYVPEPRTWFRNISVLPAGSWCRITAQGKLIGPHKYWDIGDSWRSAPDCHMTRNDVQKVVQAAVSDSVKRHLVADVPVGVFLSGGIDSGTLAGLVKEHGVEEIQAVTVAFKEFEGRHHDEVPVANKIARSFRIRHHVRTVTRKEFESDLSRLLSAMDQPSIDGINTWYASKAAAELGLKVVISGVGGDELFYGYPSFQQLPFFLSCWRQLSRIPGVQPVTNLVMNIWAYRSGNPRWRYITQARNMYGAYWLRRGLFTPVELSTLLGGKQSCEIVLSLDPGDLIESMVDALPVDAMAAVGQIESMTYLRNQLLRDSDWASMDHSVELRTPLVDAWLLHDLVPVLRSFGRFNGKSLLAGSLKAPLNQTVLSRAKTGFGIPLAEWIGQKGIALDGEELPIISEGQASRRWAVAVSQCVYA